MTYRFPIGATDLPVFEPGTSVTEPWGNNDRWVYLAAQVNRYIDGGKLAVSRLPLVGAQMVMTGLFEFEEGASRPLASAALTLYKRRLDEAGYAADIIAAKNALADSDSTVGYVNKHVAAITRTLRAVADAQGLPAARGAGIRTPFPWMFVGVAAIAVVLVSKGRRR